MYFKLSLGTIRFSSYNESNYFVEARRVLSNGTTSQASSDRMAERRRNTLFTEGEIHKGVLLNMMFFIFSRLFTLHAG